MSSDKNTTEITLLDRQYLIACLPEEQEALVQAARYLNGKMLEIRQAGKILSMERLAIMAALNITHELIQLGKQNQDSLVQVQRLTEKLAQAVDETQPWVESRKLP